MIAIIGFRYRNDTHRSLHRSYLGLAIVILLSFLFVHEFEEQMLTFPLLSNPVLPSWTVHMRYTTRNYELVYER